MERGKELKTMKPTRLRGGEGGGEGEGEGEGGLSEEADARVGCQGVGGGWGEGEGEGVGDRSDA